MNLELSLHSQTMRGFLAGTHNWFEGNLVAQRQIASITETSSWGLAAFDLAREHSFSILTLLDPYRQRMLASASALQRPLLEAVLRGYRFSFCSISKEDAQSFQDGRNKFPISKMIAAIKPKRPKVAEYLTSILPTIENPLHRFTHSDVHQISRRLKQIPQEGEPGILNIISPKTDERDVIGVLYLTTRLTIFAMQGILEQIGDNEGCEEIQHRHEELDRLVDVAGDLFEKHSEIDPEDMKP